AAPPRRLSLPTTAPMAALLWASAADARSDVGAGETLPSKIWAVQIGPKSMRALDARVLVRMRQSGVNTMFLRAGEMTPKQVAKARALGRKLGFTVISPIAEPRRETTKSEARLERLLPRSAPAQQRAPLAPSALRLVGVAMGGHERGRSPPRRRRRCSTAGEAPGQRFERAGCGDPEVGRRTVLVVRMVGGGSADERHEQPRARRRTERPARSHA